jgi:hypothetical protein
LALARLLNHAGVNKRNTTIELYRAGRPMVNNQQNQWSVRKRAEAGDGSSKKTPGTTLVRFGYLYRRIYALGQPRHVWHQVGLMW